MLIDDVKAKCKVLGYSPKTFETYWHWIRLFLMFEKNRRGAWVEVAV